MNNRCFIYNKCA